MGDWLEYSYICQLLFEAHRHSQRTRTELARRRNTLAVIPLRVHSCCISMSFQRRGRSNAVGQWRGHQLVLHIYTASQSGLQIQLSYHQNQDSTGAVIPFYPFRANVHFINRGPQIGHCNMRQDAEAWLQDAAW